MPDLLFLARILIFAKIQIVMKTKILILAAMATIVLSGLTVKKVIAMQGNDDFSKYEMIDALSNGESENVKCRCPLLANSGPCAVNRWGSICASGYNIHCDTWDSNCR